MVKCGKETNAKSQMSLTCTNNIVFFEPMSLKQTLITCWG